MMILSSLTKEYLVVEVECSINPTSDTVQFAFTTGDNPIITDWISGSWEAGTTSPYTCKVLIGAGSSKVLTAGSYYVWVKITDSPEIPVRRLTEMLVIR